MSQDLADRVVNATDLLSWLHRTQKFIIMTTEIFGNDKEMQRNVGILSTLPIVLADEEQHIAIIFDFLDF